MTNVFNIIQLNSCLDCIYVITIFLRQLIVAFVAYHTYKYILLFWLSTISFFNFFPSFTLSNCLFCIFLSSLFIVSLLRTIGVARRMFYTYAFIQISYASVANSIDILTSAHVVENETPARTKDTRTTKKSNQKPQIVHKNQAMNEQKTKNY